jgi:uncharacterized protein (DUF1697 family)
VERAGHYNDGRTVTAPCAFVPGVARYVAFLRAINVSGRRVTMDRLRSIFEDLGLEDVSTYIASGNVLFSSTQRPSALESQIQAKLEDELGYEVATYVRSAAQVHKTAAAKPFPEVSAADTHMVAFLRRKPTPAERKAIEGKSGAKDTLVVDGREVHWRIRGPMMDSELKPKDWAVLGQPTTTRGMTMLAKLAAKLDA